jgi:hypothetical protein
LLVSDRAAGGTGAVAGGHRGGLVGEEDAVAGVAAAGDRQQPEVERLLELFDRLG